MQRFATTAAHDIKNPLSSISMSAELLSQHLQKTGDERGHRLASTNLANAKTLAQLVNDMLDYSLRPEILIQNHSTITLTPFLEKTVAMISIPKNVQISYPEGDIEVKTSKTALQQIFINLLTNAVRYNDKQKCEIFITCTQVGQSSTFRVSDNGIGIRADELERIFDRNVTLNATDRFAQAGTGLGLYTVRLLVEKLGGKIRIESEPFVGSSFIFSIGKDE